MIKHYYGEETDKGKVSGVKGRRTRRLMWPQVALRTSAA